MFTVGAWAGVEQVVLVNSTGSSSPLSANPELADIHQAMQRRKGNSGQVVLGSYTEPRIFDPSSI